jgi:hypothetical protein
MDVNVNRERCKVKIWVKKRFKVKMWTVRQWQKVCELFENNFRSKLCDASIDKTEKFNNRIKILKWIASYACIIKKCRTKDWRVKNRYLDVNWLLNVFLFSFFWTWIDLRSRSLCAVPGKCFVCRKAMLWCFCNVMTSNIFSPFLVFLSGCVWRDLFA